MIRRMPKMTPLDEALQTYMLEHRSADDALLEELRAETRERVGLRAGMQIAADEGTLLGLLVASLGARRVVEVGTFTGYSALCMARALPPGGRLLCCDVSEEWTSIGRRYWEKAGVADRIDLVIAPGLETLRGLPDDVGFDFAFIDADKSSYRLYYEEILARMPAGAVIAVDNVLWGGRTIDPDDTSQDTVAIREFNDFVAGDGRVQAVMLHVSDGLTLARKL
jgi:caffeoyl-CoA O-methyltransferase